MHYRLYFLGHDGRIARGLDLECEDDAAAIDAVWGHEHEYKIELWQAARRVGSFAPEE